MKRLLLDDLTGAYQRAGLSDILDELADDYARTGADYALAMIDVDHLKTLNDVYGHATGDAALKAVAQRAASVLRQHDMLFRYGGDEFLLILPNTGHDVAERVLMRVRDEVVANPVQASVWVHVRISVGVAASDEPGDRDPDLFARADARLYVAKRVGRNTVVASDSPRRIGAHGGLNETRLVGRDAQLNQLDSFLSATVSSEPERVLTLTGQAGAGFSRFLQEASVRGKIAGRAVRHVQAEERYYGVHLRAVGRAFGDLVPPDPTASEVAEQLALDAEGHGLLVLLEGGRWLDPGSRQLLSQRLARGGAKLIEAVPAGQPAAFQGAHTAELGPLTDIEVGNWLSAALGIAVDPATAQALARAGDGRPAQVARLVKRLTAQGHLVSEGQLVSADLERLGQLARLAEQAKAAVSLPQWDAPLVGRNQWLTSSEHAVRSSRLTVLVGPGGIGKSRLAAQLARQLADDFPGGVWWVDLRSVSDVTRLPALIAEHAGLPPTDDMKELARGLSGPGRLLVLDEMDGLADAAGEVEVLLQGAPQLQLLATSRMPLRLPGERLLEVPELGFASAAELFRRGMLRVGADERATDQELERLIEQVGPSPLALELAAAWTRGLSVTELTDSLSRRPEMLATQPGTQALTARFIDLTRDLMSGAERQALGTLALLPSGFGPELARAAAGASPFFLLALLERSLLRREGTRYTLHAAIAERYRAGLQKPEAALTAVMRAVAEQAADTEALSSQERSSSGYRQVDEGFANYVWAFQAAAQRRDEEALWPLARLLRGYFDVRGRPRSGLELFQAADANLVEARDGRLRGWLKDAAALFLAQNQRYDEALRTIGEALRLLQPYGADEVAAMAWNTQGVVTGMAGAMGPALDAFLSSAEMRRRLGDALGEAQARGNVALVYKQTGRAKEALGALKESVDNYRHVQHASGVALSLFNLAQLGRTSGLLPMAQRLAYAQEALEVAESIGYVYVARSAATELAEEHEAQGQRYEAILALERAVGWARVEENEQVEALLLGRLARARKAADDRLRAPA